MGWKIELFISLVGIIVYICINAARNLPKSSPKYRIPLSTAHLPLEIPHCQRHSHLAGNSKGHHKTLRQLSRSLKGSRERYWKYLRNKAKRKKECRHSLRGKREDKAWHGGGGCSQDFCVY